MRSIARYDNERNGYGDVKLKDCKGTAQKYERDAMRVTAKENVTRK